MKVSISINVELAEGDLDLNERSDKVAALLDALLKDENIGGRVEPTKENDGLDEPAKEAEKPKKAPAKKAPAKKAPKIKPEELREAGALCSKTCGKDVAKGLISDIGGVERLAQVPDDKAAELLDAFQKAVADATPAESGEDEI